MDVFFSGRVPASFWFQREARKSSISALLKATPFSWFPREAKRTPSIWVPPKKEKETPLPALPPRPQTRLAGDPLRLRDRLLLLHADGREGKLLAGGFFFFCGEGFGRCVSKGSGCVSRGAISKERPKNGACVVAVPAVVQTGFCSHGFCFRMGGLPLVSLLNQTSEALPERPGSLPEGKEGPHPLTKVRSLFPTYE